MEIRLPAMLAAPRIDQPRPLWLTNARLFDGTGAPARDGAAVLVEDGRIVRVGSPGDAVPDGAVTVDLGGKTLMPGLINGHLHAIGQVPELGFGAEPLRPGVTTHVLGGHLREFLRYGVTTVRDMGTYGDQVLENRQAMRYGVYRGARILTCGLIISSTAPGTTIFDGMYREADGADEVRKAVREQIARGADFVKLMTTGARSVELESGIRMDTCGTAHEQPNQLTPEEMAVAVEEAHRNGYEVAAHAEGLDGCATAVDLGMRTVEHGFYLHSRPDLLDRMAAAGIALVPTFSSQYVFAGLDLAVGTDREPVPYCTPELTRLAAANIASAQKTLAAARAAGTPVMIGGDDLELRRGGVWVELLRMVHHGMPAREALVSATSAAARALGLRDLGSVEEGKLGDLIVVDGDPLADPALLGDRDRIWLVLQAGTPVAGTAVEVGAAELGERS